MAPEHPGLGGSLLEPGETRDALVGLARLRSGDGLEYFDILPDLLAMMIHLNVGPGRWLGYTRYRQLRWLPETVPTVVIDPDCLVSASGQLLATGRFRLRVRTIGVTSKSPVRPVPGSACPTGWPRGGFGPTCCAHHLQ